MEGGRGYLCHHSSQKPLSVLSLPSLSMGRSLQNLQDLRGRNRSPTDHHRQKNGAADSTDDTEEQQQPSATLRSVNPPAEPPDNDSGQQRSNEVLTCQAPNSRLKNRRMPARFLEYTVRPMIPREVSRARGIPFAPQCKTIT